MTAMQITYDAVHYLLTDESSQCSHGEPVLVAPDGTAFRGRDVVLVRPSSVDPDDGFASYFAGIEDVGGPVLARDVADRGKHAAVAGKSFRAPAEWDETYMTLTEYGRATAEMYGRFMRQ